MSASVHRVSVKDACDKTTERQRPAAERGRQGRLQRPPSTARFLLPQEPVSLCKTQAKSSPVLSTVRPGIWTAGPAHHPAEAPSFTLTWRKGLHRLFHPFPRRLINWKLSTHTLKSTHLTAAEAAGKLLGPPHAEAGLSCASPHACSHHASLPTSLVPAQGLAPWVAHAQSRREKIHGDSSGGSLVSGPQGRCQVSGTEGRPLQSLVTDPAHSPQPCMHTLTHLLPRFFHCQRTSTSHLSVCQELNT